MGGSSGGGYDTVITPSWDDDPYKRLFLGATDSQPVASADTTQYAPVMTPGQAGVGGFTAPTSDTGPGTGSNLTTTVHPDTSSGTSGAKSFGDWLMSKEGAAALQKTGESLKDPQSGQAPRGSTLTPASMPRNAQAVQGNPNSITSLLQLLSQRRYSPIGYSGGSGGSTRSLLG